MYNYHPPNYGLGAVAPGSIVTAVGGSIAASSPACGPGAPICAAIGGVVALGGQLLNIFGVGIPDLKKIQASNDANEVEQGMAQLATAWDHMEHTTANQQAVVTAWYQYWDQLARLCSDPNLGTAGQNCIKDRQRGGKWDWFAMHLDPILNTPLTDSGTVTGEVTSLFGSNGPLIIGGLLLVLGIVASGD